MWILVLHLCRECGAETFLKEYDHPPTSEDRASFVRDHGSCYKVFVGKLGQGKIMLQELP